MAMSTRIYNRVNRKGPRSAAKAEGYARKERVRAFEKQARNEKPSDDTQYEAAAKTKAASSKSRKTFMSEERQVTAKAAKSGRQAHANR
jgi:hypothetical protein